jgi:hypothetical protein
VPIDSDGLGRVMQTFLGYGEKLDDDGYRIVGVITGVITFVVSYIYCIYEYGYLLGVGLGWLPSFIVAFVAGLLWPVIAFGIAIVILLIIRG